MKIKLLILFYILNTFNAIKLLGEPASFSRIGTSAKETGMGNSVVASVEGISSIEYNPAGIAIQHSLSLFSGYSSLFEKTYNFGFFGLIPTKILNLGIGFTQLGIDDIKISDYNYNLGDFNASARILFFSIGVSQFAPIFLGLNTKYLTQNLYESKQSGLSWDLGLISNFEIIRIGFCLKNLISTKFGSESLPLVLEGGLSLNLNLQKLFKKDGKKEGVLILKLSPQINYIPAENKIEKLFGTEIIPSRFFSIYFGLNNGFAFGLGVNISFIQTNFSILLHEVLDTSYKFSLILKF